MGSATAFLLQEAALLHRQGALAEATSRYHQVLRSEPANADALYHLAVLACQQGRLMPYSASSARLAGPQMPNLLCALHR